MSQKHDAETWTGEWDSANDVTLNPPPHVIDLAIEVSGWSPCRSKRGVVLFGMTGIVAHGYNYKPRGFDCDGSEACKATCRVEAVHAEQQALLSAGYHANGCEMLHVKTVDGELVPSGGPSCVACSKLVLIAGVVGVWLYHDNGWRRYEAQDFHRQSLSSSERPRAATRDVLRAHGLRLYD
jgi:deoxycytidylate deaminase